MVNGQRSIDVGRLRQQPALGGRRQRRFHQRGNRRECEASGDEFADCDLVGDQKHIVPPR